MYAIYGRNILKMPKCEKKNARMCKRKHMHKHTKICTNMQICPNMHIYIFKICINMFSYADNMHYMFENAKGQICNYMQIKIGNYMPKICKTNYAVDREVFLLCIYMHLYAKYVQNYSRHVSMKCICKICKNMHNPPC